MFRRAPIAGPCFIDSKPARKSDEAIDDQDTAVASAIAERLIEHGELIKIEGDSYRVKKKRQKNLGLDGLTDIK